MAVKDDRKQPTPPLSWPQQKVKSIFGRYFGCYISLDTLSGIMASYKNPELRRK